MIAALKECRGTRGCRARGSMSEVPYRARRNAHTERHRSRADLSTERHLGSLGSVALKIEHPRPRCRRD
jgi:hypothetical protein